MPQSRRVLQYGPADGRVFGVSRRQLFAGRGPLLSPSRATEANLHHRRALRTDPTARSARPLPASSNPCSQLRSGPNPLTATHSGLPARCAMPDHLLRSNGKRGCASVPEGLISSDVHEMSARREKTITNAASTAAGLKHGDSESARSCNLSSGGPLGVRCCRYGTFWRLTDSTACAAFRTNEQRSVWPTLPETHAGIRLVLLSVSVSSATMSNSLLGLAIAIDQKSSDVAIASKQTKSHIKVLPLQPVGTRVIRIALG
jgi:hypothetical protein